MTHVVGEMGPEWFVPRTTGEASWVRPSTTATTGTVTMIVGGYADPPETDPPDAALVGARMPPRPPTFSGGAAVDLVTGGGGSGRNVRFGERTGRLPGLSPREMSGYAL